jgi:DNA-binding IclR family transcriptional regulator
MNAAEWSILDLFRRYLVRPSEMLFCNAGNCRITDSSFHSAMLRLVQRGLVVKERPRCAYSLTEAGYRLARSRQASARRGRPPLQQVSKQSRGDRARAANQPLAERRKAR